MAFYLRFLIPMIAASAAFHVELSPYNPLLEVGDPLEIICVAKDCPQASRFIWSAVSDTPLNGRVSSNGTNSVLTFDLVQIDHRNTIYCKVMCGSQTLKQKVTTVDVYAFQQDPVISGDGKLLEGKEVNLTCNIQNVFPPQMVVIEWLLNGELVFYDSGKADYTEQAQTVSSSYTFTPTKEDNGKVVTCRAIHRHKHIPAEKRTRKFQLCIDVRSAPRNTTLQVSPSQEVTEGQNITINCSTISSPEATLVLRRVTDGSELSSSRGVFHLQNLRPEQAGDYMVIATNELGSETKTFSLSVMVPPTNTTITMNTHGQPKEGDHVTISCQTEAMPACHMVLNRVTENGFTELESREGKSLSFTIPAIQLADVGLYECVAVNKLGKQKVSTKLMVRAAPRNTTVKVSPSQEVTEGQNITINCSTISSPEATLVLRRVTDGSELSSSRGVFHLHNLRPEQAGDYMVIATNELGSETKTFSLSIMGKYATVPEKTPGLAGVLAPSLCGASLLTILALTARHLLKLRRNDSYNLSII